MPRAAETCWATPVSVTSKVSSGIGLLVDRPRHPVLERRRIGWLVGRRVAVRQRGKSGDRVGRLLGTEILIGCVVVGRLQGGGTGVAIGVRVGAALRHAAPAGGGGRHGTAGPQSV